MKPENSALVASNYSELPREAKKTKDSTFDRIYKYYHNDKTRIELSEEEENIRKRYEMAWHLLCHYKTDKQVVEVLQASYRIGKSVAYDDLRHAKMLISDPRQNNKDAKRAIAETIALRTMEKLEAEGKWEMHEKYFQKYIDINGLKDEGGNNNMEELMKKFKPHTINIIASPADLQKMASDIQQELIRDIEFKEVGDEGEGNED